MKNNLILFLLLPGFSVFGQDTLPSFSVSNKGSNRIVVEWYNNYKQVKQISIQRSSDSLGNFKTIFTVPDPMNRQNGYLDTKAPEGPLYYRIYVHIDGSNFQVTKARKPSIDTVDIVLLTEIIAKDEADSTLTEEEEMILEKYKNTRLFLNKEKNAREKNGELQKGNKPDVLLPMFRVTANQTGTVKIVLNDFKDKDYSVRFYKEDGTFLFELKDLKKPVYMLDKSTFIVSGWYKFEIMESGKLVEKNQFYIPKEF